MRALFFLLAFIGTAVAQDYRGPMVGGQFPYGGRGGGSAIQFTTLANGGPSSTVAGSGTYSSATMSTPTAAWAGGCSGSSTISGFSASGGAFSLTATTPSAACTGYLVLTLVNSNPVNSPTVTIAAPACSVSLNFGEACNSMYLF